MSRLGEPYGGVHGALHTHIGGPPFFLAAVLFPCPLRGQSPLLLGLMVHDKFGKNCYKKYGIVSQQMHLRRWIQKHQNGLCSVTHTRTHTHHSLQLNYSIYLFPYKQSYVSVLLLTGYKPPANHDTTISFLVRGSMESIIFQHVGILMTGVESGSLRYCMH